MQTLRIRRSVLIVAAASLISCQMTQTAVESASTVARAAAGGGVDSGTLQTILASILDVVGEVFQDRQWINQWLLATLTPLVMTEEAMTIGLPAALNVLCHAPGPELAPYGAELLFPEDDGIARLIVGGEVFTSAEAEGSSIPVEVVIEAEPEGEARLTIRGGGGLFCALFVTELYVDGEPFRLYEEAAEALDASIEVREWPEAPDGPDEDAVPPELIEVTLSFSLPTTVLVEFLASEELTFWADDLAAAEVHPSGSETAAQLLELLVPSVPEEPEALPEIIEQLDRQATVTP